MRSTSLYGAPIARRTSSQTSLLAVAAAGLTLLAPGGARADTTGPGYQSAPLVMSGDQYGAARIAATDDLYVAGLTDAGNLIFSAGTPNGGGPNLLLQWAGGKFTPIVAPASGTPANGPINWTTEVIINRPVSVNASGSAVFSVGYANTASPWGTFLWDAATQSVTPVALKGMPATGHLAFTLPGGYAPAINDRGEMALIGQVKNPAGPSGFGLFSLDEGRALQSVLLPGQKLPGTNRGPVVAATDEFMQPSINDLGEIAFLSRTQSGPGHGAYWYDFDEMLSLALPGQKIPGAGTITDVGSVSLDSQDGGALITAATDQRDSSQWGLYRVAGGKISVVAAPGSTMPGGGIFKTVQYELAEENAVKLTAVSSANTANQHAFLATLEDGTAGAYMVDGAGKVSLLFKATAAAAPVRIQEVGYEMTFVPGSRPSLNNHGQVALSVRLTGGHSMIMLLSPTQP